VHSPAIKSRATDALRRLLCALFVCLLLVPHAAQAAERFVVADFDGDGQGDRASLDPANPSILQISLTTTRSTASLRSRLPIAGLAARDLDGDRRAELIARASSGLQIWTRHHTGFRPFRPLSAGPNTVGVPLRHHVQDDEDDAPAAITPAASLLALSASIRPRAPARSVATLLASGAADLHALQRFAPLAPRPPPVSL
jgi:hypothetical protein